MDDPLMIMKFDFLDFFRFMFHQRILLKTLPCAFLFRRCRLRQSVCIYTIVFLLWKVFPFKESFLDIFFLLFLIEIISISLCLHSPETLLSTVFHLWVSLKGNLTSAEAPTQYKSWSESNESNNTFEENLPASLPSRFLYSSILSQFHYRPPPPPPP